jgi:DNA polymerase V
MVGTVVAYQVNEDGTFLLAAVPAACRMLVIHSVLGSVKAGFPSPADDFACQPIDLADVLIKHPQATFLIRAGGFSMVAAGINDGDILVVDRAIKAETGHVVCAVVNGHFTVKYLRKRGGAYRLVAADPTFPDIIPSDGETIEVWGVVTSSITRLVKI